ncbi:MAG: noncanonical pyrimidine nucleotidase, YjjG family [Lachnospiraceae bacterium]|nr:noncanonical pyrimidine nucleotidase, YjjG family [Lachnospiraceae bacterium]
MKRYETILWDVDGTLLNFLKSQDFALKKAFADYQLTITEATVSLYSGINDSYWKKLELGEITKEEVLYGRFESLFQALLEKIKTEQELPSKWFCKSDGILGKIKSMPIKEFQQAYQTYLGSVYFYQDDSLELCKKLHKDFSMYVVTNGVERTQRNKLQLAGFTEWMEDIFISEMIGMPKPDKRFFDACFCQMPNFNREKTIIIGDSLSSDMLGGNRAGIATCWYNPDNLPGREDVRIDYEIRNLWEVEKILWQNHQIKN